MNIKQKQGPPRETRIHRLGEDVYEYFLREAGDFTDPEEWYGVALRVADHFHDEILRSAIRNHVRVADTAAESRGSAIKGAA
jgi:hypothetical protein